MMLADNGSVWFLSGVPDPRRDDDELVDELRRVPGSAFEAVDVSTLRVAANSGQAVLPAKTWTLTVKVTGGPGPWRARPRAFAAPLAPAARASLRGTRVTLAPGNGAFRDWSGALLGPGRVRRVHDEGPLGHRPLLALKRRPRCPSTVGGSVPGATPGGAAVRSGCRPCRSAGRLAGP
jgi:hypothetical protein